VEKINKSDREVKKAMKIRKEKSILERLKKQGFSGKITTKF